MNFKKVVEWITLLILVTLSVIVVPSLLLIFGVNQYLAIFFGLLLIIFLWILQNYFSNIFAWMIKLMWGLIIAGIIGIIIPKLTVFNNRNLSSNEIYCTLPSALILEDNPIERGFIMLGKQAVTEKTETHYIVKAYTIFRIPGSTIEVETGSEEDCGERRAHRVR